MYNDERPIFQAVRNRHHILLKTIAAEMREYDFGEIQQVDLTGRGRVAVILAMLQTLSRLTYRTYNTANVGGFQFTDVER